MLNYSWFLTLNKPLLSPPAWVFAPVWTILYISMGIALFLYAQKYEYKSKTKGYVLFFTQLLINFAWTPVFFGLQNIALALIIIVLLDISILLTILEFTKISKAAGRLLIPYFIWTMFATYLNIGILFLN